MLDNLSVSKDEFVELFNQLFPINSVDPNSFEVTEEYLVKLFQKADRDASGYLDAHELQSFLRSQGYKCDQKYLEYIMNENDVNGDGKIQLNEFV